MSKLKEGTKVTILMDVDGVLNDWSAHPTRELDTGLDYTEFHASPDGGAGFGYRLFYSKDILKRVLELHNRDNVEVKWLTTWCHSANSALRQEFGFDADLEVIGDDHHKNAFRHGWWKLHAVRDYINEHPDEFIVWIDDDLCCDNEAQNFVWDNLNTVLAVAPEPCLTHEDLDRIEEWII